MEANEHSQPTPPSPIRAVLHRYLVIAALAIVVLGASLLPGTETVDPTSVDAQPPALLVQTS